MTSVKPISQTKLGGLLVRRQCWTLSWRGKLALLAVVIVGSILVLTCIHPFLAVSDPIPSSVLIIEGWIPNYTMKEAAAEFQRGHYDHVVLLRPVLDLPDKFEAGRYSADYMANLLIQYGVPKEKETTLEPIVVQKDRTYHSALAAREWLVQQHLDVKSLDVATLGPHARRSRLLYEKAFDGNVEIGIIPLPNIEYDPAHWWRSSEGVREVIGEGIAYLYARFLFRAAANR
jgi:hypothetical protein